MSENLPGIAIIGINHKTAPVDIREKVSMKPEEQLDVSSILVNKWKVNGCILLSTCNRCEIYIATTEAKGIINEIKKWLDGYKKVNFFTNNSITYTYFGWEAVKHFIFVISSLDSQIIGEPQITNQVKEAYRNAYEHGYTNTFLNKLFDFSLNVEKQIRKDTFLTDGAISVSYAAVELARKIYSTFDNKNILLIGSGETAELAARHFLKRGAKSLSIINRTFSNAKKLADKINGMALPFDDLDKILYDTDVVISATSSKKFILSNDLLKNISIRRNHQPIFLIDLAIPRDIDPESRKNDGIFLYNIDDLQEIAAKNLENRHSEIPKAEKIIDENLETFKIWFNQRSTAATITELREYFESVRKKEFNEMKNRFPDENLNEIEYLTKRIINKLLHKHIKSLKESADNPELFQQHVDLLNDLYRLNSKKDNLKENENN